MPLTAPTALMVAPGIKGFVARVEQAACPMTRTRRSKLLADAGYPERLRGRA
jgi:hypothetical protein